MPKIVTVIQFDLSELQNMIVDTANREAESQIPNNSGYQVEFQYEEDGKLESASVTFKTS